jgi:predicted NAD/FAD-dependent oxidoreductase
MPGESAGWRRSVPGERGPIQLGGDYVSGRLMEAAARAGQDAADRAVGIPAHANDPRLG